MNKNEKNRKKMSKGLFFSLVVVDAVILVMAIVTMDLYLGVAALILALFLKQYSPSITIPKTYLKHMGLKDEEVSTEDLAQRYREKRKQERKKK